MLSMATNNLDAFLTDSFIENSLQILQSTAFRRNKVPDIACDNVNATNDTVPNICRKK